MSLCNRKLLSATGAEEGLRESEGRFRTALDDMLEGCQIIGFDWRYIYVNKAAAKQNRQPVEEMLGQTMMERYPGIEEMPAFAVFKRCMEERTPGRLENYFTFPDGATGWYDMSIAPIPEGIFILSIDITERKRAEEKLEESFAKLQSALNGIILATGQMLEFRDPYTSGHQKRVATLASAIASEMHLSEKVIDGIYLAALIHDIGKISVPSDILNKPGRISELEFGIV